MRFFTHEASDLEPLLKCLEGLKQGHEIWEMRYVVILWISLVAIIPFDLKVLDEKKQGLVSLSFYSYCHL